MKISKANWEEHKEICTIARLSPYTKGFASGGLRYVDTYYEKGWVLAAYRGKKITGFVCVRHCVRNPHTSVYYIGVLERRKGLGRALLERVLKDSPHGTIRLISEKENEDGLAFYKRLGFKVEGEGANSAGVPYWKLILQGQLL